MRRLFLLVLGALFLLSGVSFAEEVCVKCHKKVTPGIVKDWMGSKHYENDVTCSTCHGDKHKSPKTAHLAVMPDEKVCAQCHEEQYDQFVKGKHNYGWAAMNALPVTHLEPDQLMEGGKGCGGCHNMGIKSEKDKKERIKQGYRYQTNSCDECHTRHSFSKKEALDPRACRQCHMGYDHPQWEMWVSSKHGSRWLAKLAGNLPKDAPAPTCQMCHMPNGNHAVQTAWGFLGVRLPLPDDPEWKDAQITLLKALGVLDPNTGKPTARLELVKKAKLARLTKEEFDQARNNIKKVCYKCHSRSYVNFQFKQADSMFKNLDVLLAKAIKIVAGLYKDGILKKRGEQPFAYPDFLYFMRTGYGNLDQLSYIEQVLFQMYMKHRMRGYQAFFHVNPDYAYWYGWAMMVKDLGEIQELAEQMRARYGVK